MMHASGHIRPRKRKDGQNAFQLIAELPPDPVTGKRQRKYETIIGSKKDAEKALHKLLDELKNGEYIDRSDVTVEAWMPEWYKRNCVNECCTHLRVAVKKITIEVRIIVWYRAEAYTA